MMTDLQTLLKHTSRSLYLSARLLPVDVRDAFGTAYLLCRYADTIADTSLLPAEKRLYWISLFPKCVEEQNASLFDAITQEISSATTNIYEAQLLHHLSDCLQAYSRLPAAQQRAILQVVNAVCDGMKIDLQVFPDEKSGQVGCFSAKQDLENYCHLMGGAPGVFWSQLIADALSLSSDANTFLTLGKNIGDALQIVNILRDLPRDLRIGRCYFPQEDLTEHHLKAEDLLQPENSPRFEPIKQKWIDWGRMKLKSAYAYFNMLPKKQPFHRAAVAWPVLWAADTLNKLEQEKNLLDPALRVKISRCRIYGTMAATLPILLSNQLFSIWLKSKLSDGK